MLLGWGIFAIIVYAHFHIFSWCLNEGCFEGFGHYVSDMLESAPISCGWMIAMLIIGNGIFGFNAVLCILVGIIPYYLIIKWLVSIGSFQPHVGGSD